MIHPIINLNGTTKQDLLDSLLAARNALLVALDAVQGTVPHRRDYPGHEDRFRKDADEVWHRMVVLQNVEELHFDEILSLALDDEGGSTE